MEQQLEEIVREIEDEQALGRVSAVSVFRSMLNQPNMIALSSANAVGNTSGTSFSQFTVNLPRPVLETESIQLVNANIPQCVQNIPDTATTFWYYRLSSYKGLVPNPTNLYFVRLLPSYYKQEFIEENDRYGYNQTFHSYDDLATQLTLACANDLAYDNLKSQDGDEEDEVFELNFLPGEITIPYNSAINKFQMIGTNAKTDMAYKTYDARTTYALNEVVIYLDKAYISLQAANTGNTPSTIGSLFWRRVYVDIVQDWNVDTPYRSGQYVSYLDNLYVATANVIGGSTPNTNPSFSTNFPDYFYRYLMAGFNDPNILVNQGRGRIQWNQFALFELNDLVEFNGAYWGATKQNKGFIPFTINNATIWDASRSFLPGDLVLYNGVVYRALVSTLGDQPDISPTDWTVNTWTSVGSYALGEVVEHFGDQYRALRPVPPGNVSPTTNRADWVLLTWEGTTQYNVGDIVSNLTEFYIATAPSINQAPSLFSSFWSPATYWKYIALPNQVPIVGLNRISSEFDMLDTWEGVVQYPFPVGIPGQPFNPAPRRLLNSILGFTWNGIMNPALLADIDNLITTGVSTSTTTTELYNRVRPVPQYFVRYTTTPINLRASTATDTQTYTADGYCNLVYSSIISIYTTIVGGSTVDTQENTNLLAMGTMNCANLGVSFFSPFINNPLSVMGDIYTISIELQDEFGEPYVLTNNAVATFVLKITYKKDEGTK